MFNAIKLFIAGLFLAAASFVNPQASQTILGAVANPTQANPSFLSGAGVTANATSINLTSFTTRQGTPITTANIGGIGYVTIDPGTSKEENVSFTGITQNSNGSAVLTGVTRGLQDVYPYTATSSLAIAHSGGATVITSNSGAFYSQFVIAGNTSTITGVMTFASSSLPGVTSDTTNAQVGTSSFNLATVGYVNSTSFSGAPNGSVSVKGIYQEATTAQVASGTNVGSTGADLITPNRYSSLTASTSPVSVIASGTIDPSYLLNGNYNLGSTTVQSITSASTTLNGNTNETNAPVINVWGSSASSSATYGQLGLYFAATSTVISTTTSATTTIATLSIPALSSSDEVVIQNWTTTASGSGDTDNIYVNGTLLCTNLRTPNGISQLQTLTIKNLNNTGSQYYICGTNVTTTFQQGTASLSLGSNFTVSSTISNSSNNITVQNFSAYIIK